MFPLAHKPRRPWLAPWLVTALCGTLAIVLMSCTSIARPTVTPEATMDLVGTVTAQAVPVVATQTAISAASTQVAQAQATLTVQAQAQQATAGQTAAVQAAAATQAQLVQGVAAQAATATALAQSAAAQAVTATALAQIAQAQAATATALAGPAKTPTPPATPSPSATPTRTPSATPGAQACVPADPALAAMTAKATAAGLNLGCPTAATLSANGALQEFWTNVTNADPKTHLRSLMIWREDESQIYVIAGKDPAAGQGSLAAYYDTYREGEPEAPAACAALQPPAGYQMPLRGFGRVWCTFKLAATVGWPNQKEVPATLLMQPTRYGMLMKVTPNQGTTYLVALDYGAARAITSTPAP